MGSIYFKNLIDWSFKGSAIIPDQEYDFNGVYSGSSYVIKDKLYIFIQVIGNMIMSGKAVNV